MKREYTWNKRSSNQVRKQVRLDFIFISFECLICRSIKYFTWVENRPRVRHIIPNMNKGRGIGNFNYTLLKDNNYTAALEIFSR